MTNMPKQRVLITGAAGYVAGRMLSTLRQRYDLKLLDVTSQNRDGDTVEGVETVDLINPDLSAYNHHFTDVDTVIHLGHKPHTGSPIDQYYEEKQNVEMAYNVFRASYDAGVRRVVAASSNHAADWYEHALVHKRLKDIISPYEYPLSDNFYGWSKAAYENMGFVFACGFPSFDHPSGREILVEGLETGRKLEVIMVRIGHPRELEPSRYGNDPATFKRVLGCYLSARDQTQLFVKSIEATEIKNEYGIPFHIVYGISNNTRAFWSLANARQVLKYQPQDDSEVRFTDIINGFIVGETSPGGIGRVGLE